MWGWQEVSQQARTSWGCSSGCCLGRVKPWDTTLQRPCVMSILAPAVWVPLPCPRKAATSKGAVADGAETGRGVFRGRERAGFGCCSVGFQHPGLTGVSALSHTSWVSC